MRWNRNWEGLCEDSARFSHQIARISPITAIPYIYVDRYGLCPVFYSPRCTRTLVSIDSVLLIGEPERPTLTVAARRASRGYMAFVQWQNEATESNGYTATHRPLRPGLRLRPHPCMERMRLTVGRDTARRPLADAAFVGHVIERRGSHH